MSTDEVEEEAAAAGQEEEENRAVARCPPGGRWKWKEG